jgi:NADP-dependent 3-hydroxy acid dehydrogenase YdfG
MKEQKLGHIITVSSVIGHNAGIVGVVYAASWAARYYITSVLLSIVVQPAR